MIKVKSEGTIMMGIVFALAVFVFVGCTSAETHYVNPGESIQAVVNAADPDDTVIVRDGTYTENVNINKRLTIQSENGSANCIMDAGGISSAITLSADGITLEGLTVTNSGSSWADSGITVNSNNNVITRNTVSNNYGCGIFLESSCNNTITSNTVCNNTYGGGIYLGSSYNNTITSNTVSNNYDGIVLGHYCNNNTITSNTACNNYYCGINLGQYCNNNTITSNTVCNNTYYSGIALGPYCNNNTITSNTVCNNYCSGINLESSCNNLIYHNNLINNTYNVHSYKSSNIWNSTEPITYTYNGNTFTNYMGNYWDSYTDADANNDGIWDTSYTTPDTNSDGYPLVEQWENYFPPTENIFDTDEGTYPSISGTHNGTITLNQTINVSKLYTYPCTGTGGHTQYVKIWNSTDWNVTAMWEGYTGDWHNISFDEPFTLKADEEYNYTIITGSYPQIYHTDALPTENGWINCTKFTDVNGKEYHDWIPAIRLK